ncbi:MAG: hypothetical protein IT425_01450 [Pirellulales bacterium]|nr:hypothetical protein [Pirellulales bacterium]
MKSEQSRNLQDVMVFVLLVGIGAAGRWGQPTWCFTPTAAAAIFAGWYFSRWAVAALVPIAILALSDLLLPAYDNLPVLLVTYAAMTLPIWLGQLQRNNSLARWHAAACWAAIGFVPATIFFILSNFAVWAFQSNYEKSLAGLVQCYTAALPFYRSMLTGDLFYLSVLLACSALAGLPVWGSKTNNPPAA